MARDMRVDTEWVVLPGKSLAAIESMAIRSSYVRHKGNQRKMRDELGIAKSSLLRKMDRLGLPRQRRARWSLSEAAISRAFFKHCESIAEELNISTSTLLRWVNARAPFRVEE